MNTEKKIKALIKSKKALAAGDQEKFKSELKLALKHNGGFDCFWDKYSATNGEGVTVEMLTELIECYENFDPSNC